MPDDSTTRRVGSRIDANVTATSELLLSVAVASGLPLAEEHLTITVGGSELRPVEHPAAHGTRLHLVTGVPAGDLVVDYRATVTGRAPAPETTELDRFTYLRPSRYVDSDRMFAVAQAEFTGLSGQQLVDSVTSWVGSQLAYVSGSSRPIDGAVDTYLARQGVCRDYAHLVIALLRGLGLPARLASVYAPGLSPMDFHAVAEVLIDGQWCVVDATAMAPRSTLVRIATGRDAADTAFMTTLSGNVILNDVSVTATASPSLPDDDVTRLVGLR